MSRVVFFPMNWREFGSSWLPDASGVEMTQWFFWLIYSVKIAGNKDCHHAGNSAGDLYGMVKT